MAHPSHGGRLGAFIDLLTTNRLTIFGATLATVSVGAIAVMFALLVLGIVHHGYVGLVLFLILPGLFILGLVLIPVGAWWQRKSGVARDEELRKHPFPVLDFNSERTRSVFMSIVLLTAANIVLLGFVSYQGVGYTESNTFCGTACHGVMEPHYVAFLDSPHANTGCVECHVGPGATGFISAKLAGVRQLVEVMTNSYPQPVPTPREPGFVASVACEHCHTGERRNEYLLRVQEKYLADEANSLVHTVLLMNMGNAEADAGIHGWHNQPGRVIEYLPADDELQAIAAVRVTEPDGEVTVYETSEEVEIEEGEVAGAWRTMTCIDCHNRVGHDFTAPEAAIDAHMATGDIDPALPGVKEASTVALLAAIENTNEDVIAQTLENFYSEQYPEVEAEQGAAVLEAVDALRAIFKRNVFADMNVTWDTYPDFSGHTETNGCFRCHDDSHAAPGGALIRQDCIICHNVLAWDEDAPAVLEQLQIGGGE